MNSSKIVISSLSRPQVASQKHLHRSSAVSGQVAVAALQPRLAPLPPSDSIKILVGLKRYSEAISAYKQLKQRDDIYGLAKSNFVRADKELLNLVLNAAAKVNDASVIKSCLNDLWALGAEPHPDQYFLVEWLDDDLRRSVN